MVYIGVDYFQVSKNKTERVLEVPMDTKTDFFGNSKNGGTKFEKVLLRVPILSVPWTVQRSILTKVYLQLSSVWLLSFQLQKQLQRSKFPSISYINKLIGYLD